MILDSKIISYGHKGLCHKYCLCDLYWEECNISLYTLPHASFKLRRFPWRDAQGCRATCRFTLFIQKPIFYQFCEWRMIIIPHTLRSGLLPWAFSEAPSPLVGVDTWSGAAAWQRACVSQNRLVRFPRKPHVWQYRNHSTHGAYSW